MVSVLQVVDTLKQGGLEAVAANYANRLAGRGMRSYICSTRGSGPLAKTLARGVTHLDLRRRGRFDPFALKRFVGFIRREEIDIVHAHGPSLFFSALATLFARPCRLLWHDHFGPYLTVQRPAWLYRLGVSGVAGMIAVNRPLARWGHERLKLPADRVWCVPNFTVRPAEPAEVPELPGTPGKRIVCVASLREQKDHVSLIDAMKRVHDQEPSASLLLVGAHPDRSQAARVEERIREHALQDHVFLLGCRSDVWGILSGCDIGVLSSASEGMPLALLEYGAAGLPAVATRVGDVPVMLDGGRAGLLVSPGQPGEMAAALLTLLQSAELRDSLRRAWTRRVADVYSEDSIIGQVLRIYETLLGPDMTLRPLRR